MSHNMYCNLSYMKVLINIFFTLFWINASAQEVYNDWKDLAEKTVLKEYIENYMYSHLEFQQSEEDTTKNSGVQVSYGSSSKKIVIRDKTSISAPETPLLVINGYPIENHIILKKIKLADIERISLIQSAEQAHAIYGIGGKYGVVLIEMNKRRWKKLKKEFLDN